MKRLIFTITCLALLATPVLAVPSLGGWEEGAPRSIHALWTFSDPCVAGPDGLGIYTALPEELIEFLPPEIGTPAIALISGDSLIFDDGFTGDDIGVVLKIENYEDGINKILVVAVNSNVAPVVTLVVAVDGGPIDWEFIRPPDGADFAIMFEPNPRFEEIHFTIPGDDASLSSIHLDSLCVIPAPGAILLGGIGTCLVGWLRRRRVL